MNNQIIQAVLPPQKKFVEAQVFERGPQGIPGEAATIEVGTVTTGAAGTDASVTNNGTENAAIFDFVIPRGDKGETGETGPTGNGIASYTKTSTSGLVDTYTITFTNGNTTTVDVTNGKSISSIAKTSTSGLVDIYTITYNDNTTSTFTVTNGYSPTATVSKVDNVSTLTVTDKNGTTTTNILDGGVDADLSNLSTVGNARLHALKGYEDAGELLTDTEGLSDVKSYAHSTFDVSKFTVTGTPSIIDGVATNFSADDYISTLGKFTIDVSKNFEVHVKVNVKYINGLGDTNVFKFINSNNSSIGRFALRYNGKSFYLTSEGSGNGSTSTGVRQISYSQDCTLDLIFGLNGTSFYSKYKRSFDTNWSALNTTTISLADNFGESYITFGLGYPRYMKSTNGSIDLKEFEIYQDNVLVFSGNRTGIDTIKPDNYTVVGTPTISADGIYTIPTSNSNYITMGNYDLSKNFEITLPFNITSFVSYTGLLRIKDSIVEFTPYVDSGGNLLIYNKDNNNTGSYTSWVHLQLGKHVLKIKGDGTNITFNVYKSNGEQVGTTGTFAYSNFTLGSSVAVSTSMSNTFTPASIAGSIDLNEFKIYVDGNLVYQPCLKIPYTESKTGSKIVDSIYRDRVSDMYGQFGYAPYYTLSDNDFTLPMGELYGIMRKNTDGQWIYKHAEIATDVAWGTDTPEATYSLASYLPDDEYDYEVLFIGTVRTSSTSGDFATLLLKTDIITPSGIPIAYARTRTASEMGGQGNGILPVGQGRFVKQYSTSSANANGTYTLQARAYRRIGKNS